MSELENIYCLVDPLIPLSVDEFEKIPHDTIFSRGELPNSPEGLYMTDAQHGRMLRWMAKKGGGNDWAIYCYWAKTGHPFGDDNEASAEWETYWDYIRVHGDKVKDDRNIRKCVNVSDEVMRLYRK